MSGIYHKNKEWANVTEINKSGVTATATLEKVTVNGTTYGVPAAPTVNNNTITIQLNGTTIESFTLNQNSDETINIQVSKSDVGLGNVPNVATDDQTPTVTEASTRANLAVGDSLKTIIGKIKKFFADLKTVAFTGSYTDLSDKPTIPTVNNGTLTIQKNGTDVTTFTANQSSNATANITVPTGDLASINKDGTSSTKYLRGDGTWQTFPSIPAAQVNSDWNASSGVAEILNKPTIPTIPSNNITGSGTNGKLTKWNGANTITDGPALSSAISSQTQSTKFLREDGTWSAPSYTTNTDEKVKQTNTTSSTVRSVMLASNNSTSEATAQAYKNSSLKYKPSDGTLSNTGSIETTGYFKGNLHLQDTNSILWNDNGVERSARPTIASSFNYVNKIPTGSAIVTYISDIIHTETPGQYIDANGYANFGSKDGYMLLAAYPQGKAAHFQVSQNGSSPPTWIGYLWSWGTKVTSWTAGNYTVRMVWLKL